jgi:hypothetical protein
MRDEDPAGSSNKLSSQARITILSSCHGGSGASLFIYRYLHVPAAMLPSLFDYPQPGRTYVRTV